MTPFSTSFSADARQPVAPHLRELRFPVDDAAAFRQSPHRRASVAQLCPVGRLLLDDRFSSTAEKAVYPYRHPDLDGLASAIALAEMSQTLHLRPMRAFMTGVAQREARWAFDFVGLPLPENRENFFGDTILVDTPYVSEVGPWLSRSNVCGVVDHHADIDPFLMENAAYSHGHVGANATLVSEIARQIGFTFSKSTAGLLYLAVMSNTCALRTSDTTARDTVAAGELEASSGLSLDDVWAMFTAKSALPQEPLLETLLPDVSPVDYSFAGRRCVFAQLEISGVGSLLDSRGRELTSALSDIAEMRRSTFVILSMLELGEKPGDAGVTYFVFNDHGPAAKLLVGIGDLRVSDDGLLYAPRLLTRKHAIRILRDELKVES